ncbi:MAG: hypothetical protein QOF49_1364 [Chloroflexota bacterium]|nr:hypothetical protein [Chloroflexota bacterium]
MHPTRPLGPILMIVLAGSGLVGCVRAATVAESPPPLPPAVIVAASASIRPAGSIGVAASVSPSETPVATASPVPSADPTDESGTAGPGCGTGQAGVLAHNGEIPAMLRFGAATIEFTNISVSMHDRTYDASDSIPGGLGLTANEIAVVVRRGDRIVLRADGVILTATQARAVPWRNVDFEGGLASLRGDPVELAWRRRADGSLSISAPDETGDFAVELSPGWTGRCIEGGGVAYSRIKVR